MNTEQTQIKVGVEEHTAYYPTVGQKIKIENLKNVLSEGQYAVLANNGTKHSDELLDIIDAFAYLSVCCPTIKLDFNNFSSMTTKLQFTLVYAFKKFYYPWYMSIQEEIEKLMEEISKQSDIATSGE